MIVGARKGGLSILEIAEFLEFAENGEKNKKHPVFGKAKKRSLFLVREVSLRLILWLDARSQHAED